jgi:hypothetical protein
MLKDAPRKTDLNLSALERRISSKGIDEYQGLNLQDEIIKSIANK